MNESKKSMKNNFVLKRNKRKKRKEERSNIKNKGRENKYMKRKG